MIVFEKYHYLDAGIVKYISEVSELKKGTVYFSITKNEENQIVFKFSKCTDISKEGVPFFDELYRSVDWRNYTLFRGTNVKSKLIHYG